MKGATRLIEKWVFFKPLPIEGSEVWQRRTGRHLVAQEFWMNPNGHGEGWEDTHWAERRIA